MKKIYIILLSCLLSSVSFSQEITNFNYIFVKEFYNPAIIGSSGLEAKLIRNSQWSGFEGAPKTNYISANLPLSVTRQARGPLGKSNKSNIHGFGISLLSDKAGSISKKGGYLGYGYHIKVSNNYHFSGGISLGFLSYKFNNDNVILNDKNDPAGYPDYKGVKNITPDLNTGVYLYSDFIFFGIGINHVYETKVKLYNDNILKQTYNSIIGGSLFLDPAQKMKLESSVLFDYNQKLMFGLNITAKWNNMIWAGLSYSSNKVYAPILGVSFFNGYLAYSYKIVNSDLGKVTNGTHEIVLGYNFSEKNN